MSEEKEQKPQKITIKLSREAMIDKNGKEVLDPNKEVQYRRDDAIGLQSLLGRFDNRKHPGAMKLIRSVLNVQDKVREAWQKEKKEINLMLEEATFIKQYLEHITDNEAKENQLREFEMRTLVAVLDQLE